MPNVYEVSLPDGRKFHVTSDHPLSEAEVYQHATNSANLGSDLSKAVGPSNAAPADNRSAVERFFSRVLPSTTPSDYVKGPLMAVEHPLLSAGLLKDAITSDPVGAIPVVGRVKQGAQDLNEGNYAGAAGDAAGLLLDWFGGKKAAPGATAAIEDAASAAAKATARGAGKTASAVGRVAENVGASKTARGLAYAGGVGDALLHGNLGRAGLEAAVPPVLEYGGRGLQKLGDALQSLGQVPPSAGQVDRYAPNRGRASREVPGYTMPASAAPTPPLPTSVMADVDPHMPNVSGYSPNLDWPHQESLPTSSLVDIDRYMPNTSSAPVREYTPSTADFTSERPAPPGNAPRPSSEPPAPPVTDTLQNAIDSIRQDESPVTSTRATNSLADTPAARTQGSGEGATFTGAPSYSSGVPRATLANENLPNDFQVVEGSASPTDRLSQATGSITGDMMPFSDFSEGIDKIVNETTPEDLQNIFPAKSQPSRPTAAWRAWLLRHQMSDLAGAR